MNEGRKEREEEKNKDKTGKKKKTRMVERFEKDTYTQIHTHKKRKKIASGITTTHPPIHTRK